MRAWHGVILVLLLTNTAAFAQDEPKPDQLKKMHEDTLAQLKSAQDRKNELAIENEKLNARLTELQKEMAAMKAESESLKREAAGYAEKSFYLRAHYTAWQNFLKNYPGMLARWKLFLQGSLLDGPNDPSALMDPDWPLSALGTSPAPPATKPSIEMK